MNSRTIWVGNLAVQRGRFVPLVPGSDTSSTFAQSLVLTGQRHRAGADREPGARIPDNGIASDQMWQTVWGVLS